MRIFNQQEFGDLQLKDQVVLSSLLGKYMISRMDKEYIVKLYFLHYYYVEVYLSRKEGEVLYVRSFIEDKYLDPYLYRIELPAL
jgi:hypothetical protein